MQITIEKNLDESDVESYIQKMQDDLGNAATDEELLQGLAQAIAATGLPAPPFVRCGLVLVYSDIVCTNCLLISIHHSLQCTTFTCAKQVHNEVKNKGERIYFRKGKPSHQLAVVGVTWY